MNSGLPCTDHLGNNWPSRAAMLRHYGISGTVYDYRFNVKNWTLEKTLTTPIIDTDLAGAHACKDHLGNEFPSKKAMCEYWHVPRNVFFSRLRAGKTLEEALNPETSGMRGKGRPATPVKDHLGQEYYNLDAMCAKWGIPKSQYIINIRNGLCLEDALTKRTEKPKRPKDHLGNEYRSVNAMCAHYGITKNTLRGRLEMAWTLKDILEHPEDSSHWIKAIDHLGNKWPTQKDMLAHYGVNYITYTYRRDKLKWPLAMCLDPHDAHVVPSEDHEGNVFPYQIAMLEYWHIGIGTYRHRIDAMGLDNARALEYRRTGSTPFPGMRISKRLSGGFFLVEYKGTECVMSGKGVHSLLCRLKLQEKIRTGNGDLGNGLHAEAVDQYWTRLWGGTAGPSPGIILGPRAAWLMAVQARYAEKKPKGTDKNDDNP